MIILTVTSSGCSNTLHRKKWEVAASEKEKEDHTWKNQSSEREDCTQTHNSCILSPASNKFSFHKSGQ